MGKIKVKMKLRGRPGQTALLLSGLLLSFGFILGCGDKGRMTTAEASVKPSAPQTAEPKSGESQSVEPKVQSEIARVEAERRAKLLKDGQSAFEDTENALEALDRGDGKAALAALARATGKLDLIVAREPTLAFAPVAVGTTVHDLYARPETVKAEVKAARDDLSDNRVQAARGILEDLASQAEIHLTELPLVTYPAAIKAVAPLIDAGHLDAAKATLAAALNTVIIETLIIPLPQVRAETLLTAAADLAAKKNRTEDENKTMRGLIDAARNEVQLAEALGYGSKESYKPLYAQIDDIQKQLAAGQSGRGIFDKLQNSLKNFKFLG